MSFTKWKDTIELGDQVVLYMNPERMPVITITEDGEFNNKFGRFSHAQMIGKRYGSKMRSHNGKGYLHLLQPTPEIWTNVLPHRTQILYFPDIALISSFLDLKPGVKMIESGTGSGSFSHSIARTIGPTGHLYTFEYHEERAQKAKTEFEAHGLSDVITVECRDVCKDGFGITDSVEAVFLDLPAPWEALKAAKEAFNKKRTGKICCFSPNIEQVQKTCTALKELNFSDIRMYECLIRHNDVKTITVEQIGTRQKNNKGWNNNKGGKRKLDNTGNPSDTPTEEAEKRSTAGPSDKPEGSEQQSAPEQPTASESVSTSKEMVVSKPHPQMRGHTSYLTFATLLPEVGSTSGSVAKSSAGSSAEGASDPAVQSDADSKAMDVDGKDA
ncbi:tRNA (adenine-N(1)-)-methyltransferase catalytic subunit trm61 [Quaeritorhiza haematococci]|nr:tRNA (adenine-N(1)-)-methyltransferase catalytic subunit trm61 [Quaeritorhiza haematococci]